MIDSPAWKRIEEKLERLGPPEPEPPPDVRAAYQRHERRTNLQILKISIETHSKSLARCLEPDCDECEDLRLILSWKRERLATLSAEPHG